MTGGATTKVPLKTPSHHGKHPLKSPTGADNADGDASENIGSSIALDNEIITLKSHLKNLEQTEKQKG